jgi:hypothetical protein
MLDYLYTKFGPAAEINAISIHKPAVPVEVMHYVTRQASLFVAPFFSATASMLLYNRVAGYTGFEADFSGRHCARKPHIRVVWPQLLHAADIDEDMGGRRLRR